MSGGNRSFLAGAKGRLLPFSIPFRFFNAAAAYHLLAWLTLAWGASDLAGFRGGLGWPLAALHLVTLGVLLMTAIGASLQLMPVATRQPLYWQHAPAAIWWLYAPAVALIAVGMGTASPPLLVIGTIGVVLALAGYGVLLSRNLVGARGMPGVVAHGWVALVSLAIVIATALALVLAYAGSPLVERSVALALHASFAAFGLMGMLALGLSYILVPMFALSAAPDERLAVVSCVLATVALGIAAVAAFGIATRTLRIAALACGLAAVAVHLSLMLRALREGLRRERGSALALIRLAWGLLVATLVLALALELGLPLANGPLLFGVALIAGWLLTFVLGVLQRIAPFLASMHAVTGGGRPPTPSMLTNGPALAIHFRCHVAALVLLAAAVLAENAWIARAASMAGLAGAAAYCAFIATLQARVRGPERGAMSLSVADDPRRKP